MATAKTEQQNDPFIALVALDDGSGNIACSYHNDEGKLVEVYQPSVIEAGAAAGIGASHMSSSIWETAEGNRFTVRKNPTRQLSTLDPDYQLSEANRVLAIDTMAKAGLGGVACAVGCTLPVEQFYNRGDSKNPIDSARIEAKIRNIQAACSNVYGAFEAPIVVHASVFPEALPAYYYCAYGERADRGEEALDYPEEHKTLVVDLGEFTDDLAIISTDNEIVDFATHENGVHVMVAHFHTLLARESATLGLADVKSMTDADVKAVITRGYIGSNLTTPAAVAARIDVKHLVTEAAEYLNARLLADIRELTRGQIANLTRIVFVGGGANWLRTQAKKWHHTVDIPAQPELAIMRGVQLMLQADKANITKRAKKALAKMTAEQE